MVVVGEKTQRRHDPSIGITILCEEKFCILGAYPVLLRGVAPRVMVRVSKSEVTDRKTKCQEKLFTAALNLPTTRHNTDVKPI
jgi:hypothetical protein